jgi:type IV pilus assembly protein PilM
VADRSNSHKQAPGMRPKLACEIRAEGVIAARGSSHRHHGETVTAFAALPEGALTPGLKVPNVANAGAVTAAVESALGEVNAKTKELTLVVPDAAARVLLLDFDTLPAKRSETLPVVRFRLRKMVPFEVESASVSYQVMAERAGQLSVLVTVMPGDVLAEYEKVIRDAGYTPGVVLPSTLAIAAGIENSDAALMVNQAGSSVTTAVTQGDEMLLHRLMELPADERIRDQEMAQAVITALAWYEDTLRATPAALYYAGPGGASAARSSPWAAMVEPVPRIEDFSVPEQASTMTSIPAGLTAGVTGALAG